MGMTELIKQGNLVYADKIGEFFAWYNVVGRRILDTLHIIFNNIFNVLLFMAVLVSLLYFIMAIYSIFKKREPRDEWDYDGELPFVTVQIPTFNEIVAIRCAKSCLNFHYPKDKYEILIGDDSNKPEISNKLQEFAIQHEMVKVIKRGTNEGFKPGNLNNMLKYSKGEFIVIFDSDFIPKEDFLGEIIKPFMKNKNIAGVQGRWKLINPNQNMVTVLGATIISTCHFITMPFMFRRRKITFLCGSAEAVRKSTLIELGGWDNGNLTEDIEFSLRLLQRGYKIEYLDHLECDSEVPYTLKDLYRQQMRWAYGVIHSWRKHFVGMAKSKHLNIIDNFYMQGIFCSGYLISVLLAALFITGTLSFITHPPAPVEWGKFLSELARNILLTSGLIVAGIVALIKANNIKLTLPMIVSSISYGLVVTYYVNIGIFKALSNIPMKWFMLNKKGNELVE